MLKLDFAKAFATVNWLGSNSILAARGFNSKWRRWMRCILNSSRSVVRVNGVPGPWIWCKCGLRQGDPISPYLFLRVAYTLQALIKRLSSTIRYPIDQASGAVTLQYADDTLIVLRDETNGVSKLKEVLDMCSPMQLA